MNLTERTSRPIESYRDLFVWQKAMGLVVATYRIANLLPATERYGLASQLRRSAVSIPANIAEGHGRRHRGDYLHSLSVANGSLKELETQLLLTVRLQYCQAAEVEPVLQRAYEVGRMLAGLIQKLKIK